ncbi:hypothetical protein LLH03_13470 [bacterium]|nr:hypothetical protein [bacterium]
MIGLAAAIGGVDHQLARRGFQAAALREFLAVSPDRLTTELDPRADSQADREGLQRLQVDVSSPKARGEKQRVYVTLDPSRRYVCRAHWVHKVVADKAGPLSQERLQSLAEGFASSHSLFVGAQTRLLTAKPAQEAGPGAYTFTWELTMPPRGPRIGQARVTLSPVDGAPLHAEFTIHDPSLLARFTISRTEALRLAIGALPPRYQRGSVALRGVSVVNTAAAGKPATPAWRFLFEEGSRPEYPASAATLYTVLVDGDSGSAQLESTSTQAR